MYEGIRLLGGEIAFVIIEPHNFVSRRLFCDVDAPDNIDPF